MVSPDKMCPHQLAADCTARSCVTAMQDTGDVLPWPKYLGITAVFIFTSSSVCGVMLKAQTDVTETNQHALLLKDLLLVLRSSLLSKVNRASG